MTWISNGLEARVKRGVGIGGSEVIPEVELRDRSGQCWWGYMASIEQIEERFRHYGASGESSGGAYFWATGLIIVRDTSDETLRAAVNDLTATGQFSRALELLADATHS